MGRLVQQPPPARTYRERASRRGGSAVLCPGRGTGLGRLTQAKPPPRNPARFKRHGRGALGRKRLDPTVRARGRTGGPPGQRPRDRGGELPLRAAKRATSKIPI